MGRGFPPESKEWNKSLCDMDILYQTYQASQIQSICLFNIADPHRSFFHCSGYSVTHSAE